jgi:hypothetical protein
MDNKNISATKIQKVFRGYICRRKIYNLNDSFTYEILLEYITAYNSYVKTQKKINEKLLNKKIRIANYPSEITENLVKFAFKKKYKICPCWDTKRGDLHLWNFQMNS